MIGNIKKYYKLLILLAVVILIVLSPAKDYIDINKAIDLLHKVKDKESAPYIFLSIYIGGMIFFLPTLLLTLIAAPLFGFWKGVLLVIIATNTGCQLIFFVTRFLAREKVKKFIKKKALFDKMSKKLENDGFMVLLYLRMFPVIPFHVVNYLSGLTPISYKDYSIATFLGLLPGIVMYVYLSSTATNIRDNPMGVIISFAILALFGIIFFLIKRKRKLLIESSQND